MEDSAEVTRLRSAVSRLTKERDDLEIELLVAQKSGERIAEPLSRLRSRLKPVYSLLQYIFGDIEEILPDETSQTAAPPNANANGSAIWDSWKTKLPGAPAKIIEALLLHSDASVEQLVVLTGISRKKTLYDAIHRMNKAGIINKNGGRFSLKQL